MADDPLSGLGTPLPLGPDLRARLEAVLLGDEVPVLDGLDAPLPLSPALRASLESRLLAPSRSSGRRWAAASAAAAAALVGGLLLVPRPSPTAPDSRPVAAPPSWLAVLTAPTPAEARFYGSTAGTLTTEAAPASSERLALRNLQKSVSLDSVLPFASLVVAPSTAPIGTWVELRGPGLGSVTQVLFGTARASAVRAVSATVLEVLVPAGIGTVVVTTDRGQRGTFTYP